MIEEDRYFLGVERRRSPTELELVDHWSGEHASDFDRRVTVFRHRICTYFSHHPEYTLSSPPPIEVVHELLETWPGGRLAYRSIHGIPLTAPPLYELADPNNLLKRRVA